MKLDRLNGLPRAVLIEAVYLIGHRLTHAIDLGGGVPIRTSALDAAGETQARDVALAVVGDIELDVGGPIDTLSNRQRSELAIRLHELLRRHIGHADTVKERASVELAELESA